MSNWFSSILGSPSSAQRAHVAEAADSLAARLRHELDSDTSHEDAISSIITLLDRIEKQKELIKALERLLVAKDVEISALKAGRSEYHEESVSQRPRPLVAWTFFVGGAPSDKWVQAIAAACDARGFSASLDPLSASTARRPILVAFRMQSRLITEDVLNPARELARSPSSSGIVLVFVHNLGVMPKGTVRARSKCDADAFDKLEAEFPHFVDLVFQEDLPRDCPQNASELARLVTILSSL